MFNFLKTVCSAVAALTLALPLEAAEYEKEVIASGLDSPLVYGFFTEWRYAGYGTGWAIAGYS